MSIAHFFRKLFRINNDISDLPETVEAPAEPVKPEYTLPDWFNESYSLEGLEDIIVKIYNHREISLNDEIALLNVIDYALFKFERCKKNHSTESMFDVSDEAAKNFVYTVSSNWTNLSFIEISGLDSMTGTVVTYLVSQNVQFALVVFDIHTDEGRIFDHYLIRHNGRSIKSTDYTVIEGLFDNEDSPAKTKPYVEL